MEFTGNLAQSQPFDQKSGNLLFAFGQMMISEKGVERGETADLLTMEVVQPFLRT